MPLFRASLRLATQVPSPVKWSHSFFVLTSDVAAAAVLLAESWTNSMRAAHYNDVYAYETYATDLDRNTTTFIIHPIPAASQRGTRSPANRGDVLPFWNVVRLDLTVAGSRSSRKFVRPTLREQDVLANHTLEGATETAIRDGFAFLALDGRYRDESGNLFTNVGRVSVTSRRLGRQAGFNVPDEPPLG